MGEDSTLSDTDYDREVLVNVLVYHTRHDIKGCSCGWSVLGASWPEHVATVYEETLEQKRICPQCRASGWKILLNKENLCPACRTLWAIGPLNQFIKREVRPPARSADSDL